MPVSTEYVSEVSICNQALGWLGENPITSLDDQTPAASLCYHNYAGLRDSVLEGYEWSFAIRREQLALLDQDPVGYGNAFQVPTDVLRVLKCSKDGRFQREEPALQWEIEGDKILCDESTIYTRSVIRIEDPMQFSANFVQALAARIAMELAIPITNSRTLQTDMTRMYAGKLADAVTTDGMQGRNKRIRSTWLLRSR